MLVIGRHHSAAEHEPRIKSWTDGRRRHDKSVRNAGFAKPCLFRLRHGILLQPVGPVLVFGGAVLFADADRWRRLPVSGLSAEDGGRDGCWTYTFDVSRLTPVIASEAKQSKS
jgi:hypothetical protein